MMTPSRLRMMISLLLALAAATPLFPAAYERPYLIPKLEYQEIGPWYELYLRKAIQEAVKERADVLILELDTPGGRVDTALKLVNRLLDFDGDVVVFVNKNAISAGALLSLTGKRIFVSSGGVFGASTPVHVGEKGMVKAPEKMVSVMRAEFRALAEKRGRPVRVCEAMVDEELGLTRERDGFDLPKGKLLTLSADEALRLKISDGTVSNFDDLTGRLGVRREAVKVFELKNSLRILDFLSSPVLLGILLSLGVLGLYYEVTHPTWGVAGTLGVLCLTAFFTIQILVANASWQAPALFAVGVVLLLLEIFLIPGFGITGILGVLLTVAGIFLSFGISNWVTALYTVSASLAFVLAVVGLSFRFLPESRLFKRFSLDSTIARTAAEPIAGKVEPGAAGKALTDLRPQGIGVFAEVQYDVQSESGYIPRGSPLRVVRVEASRLVVRGDS
ncbi:MAG: nodulation protein NfeD [Spirochaetes bacterium]|nr:nodulation protein NfeD [Spirochaetota bacterium]